MIPGDVEAGVYGPASNHLEGIDAIAYPDLEHALSPERRKAEEVGDKGCFISEPVTADFIKVCGGTRGRTGSLTSYCL
jgi:RecA/RadA recombinase